MLDDLFTRYRAYMNELVQFGDKPARARVRNAKQYFQLPSNVSTLDTKELKGRDTYIWSDQHFGHTNIIRYANRPFTSMKQMTDELIDRHNSVVKPNDVCIWAGDIAFLPDDRANEILNQCNGYKILVVGNHDFQKRRLKKLAVDEIHLLYMVETPSVTCVISHFPFPVPLPIINIHGHIHDAKEQDYQHLNVSVEQLNYCPVLLADLITVAAEMQDIINTRGSIEF